jgi:hypothetical protein
VESDNHFNHHPSRPAGRNFRDAETFWVRWERQITVGLPSVHAAIFIIRVGFCSATEVFADDTRRQTLMAALESMSPATRRYKGLGGPAFGDLMKLLR